MINGLFGPPGAGKSYEAVVFHAIKEILSQRLVITNLPLLVDALEEAYPGCSEFILLKQSTASNPIPFSTIADYGHPWRHPETGSGPLYIIDEAYMALPRGSTPPAIRTWFAMHRHESADVILISQSYGKIDKDICDLIQVVYRLRKNVAFGSQNTYIRKVFDGLRGDNVNTDIRRYDPKFFKFYSSHTQGGGKELAPKDIKPIWRHWSVYGLAIILAILGYKFAVHGNPVSNLVGTGSKPVAGKPGHSGPPGPPKPLPSPSGHAAIPPASPRPAPGAPPPPPKVEAPYACCGLHLVGHVISKKKQAYFVGLSQNGGWIGQVSDDDLRKAGYSFEPVNPCLAILRFAGQMQYIVCDAPRLSLGTTVGRMTGSE